jgi:glutamate synthase (NADPH/NADH) large chain
MISETRYHDDFLGAQTFAETTPEQQTALKALVEEHVRLAKSALGKRLVAEWAIAAKDFVLFTPKPQA